MVCVVSYETDGVVHTPQIKCAAVVTDQMNTRGMMKGPITRV